MPSEANVSHTLSLGDLNGLFSVERGKRLGRCRHFMHVFETVREGRFGSRLSFLCLYVGRDFQDGGEIGIGWRIVGRVRQARRPRWTGSSGQEDIGRFRITARALRLDKHPEN